jgi:hypothetical protein
MSTGSDFLLVEPDARTAALSGAFCAVADDSNAVLFNPAGLVLCRNDIFSFTYYSSFADTSYEYFSFAHAAGDFAYGASLLYDSTANFNWINSAGVNNGAVENYDVVVSGAAAYSIFPWLSAGLNVKYFQSILYTYSKQGMAVDAGVLLKLRDDPGVFLGCSLQNLGSQSAYDLITDALPANLRIGVAVKYAATEYCKMTYAAEIDRLIFMDDLPDICAGIEAEFYGMYFLRAGIGLKNEGNSASIGVGVLLLNRLNVSYTFQPLGDLGNAQRISTDIDF